MTDAQTAGTKTTQTFTDVTIVEGSSAVHAERHQLLFWIGLAVKGNQSVPSVTLTRRVGLEASVFPWRHFKGASGSLPKNWLCRNPMNL